MIVGVDIREYVQQFLEAEVMLHVFEQAGQQRGYGNVVILKHRNQMSSLYAHLHAIGRARYLEQIRGLAVGGAEATVQSGRLHSVGGLSFAIPPGFSPALSGNVLSAKALDAELSIVRLSGALLRDAARAALCSAPYVAREAGGHRALIGTLGGDDSARVALVGDRTSVHVVAVSGPSRDLVLDRVLESVRRIDSGAMPRLAIVGAPRRMRFADFVRERCPGTDPALARSLNGLDDGAVVEAGHPLKCATK